MLPPCHIFPENSHFFLLIVGMMSLFPLKTIEHTVFSYDIFP